MMEYRKIDFTGCPDDSSGPLNAGLGGEMKNICRHDAYHAISNPPDPPLPSPPEGFRLWYYETYNQISNLHPDMSGTQNIDFSMGCILQEFRKITWIHNETSEVKLLDEKIGEPKRMILCGGSIDPFFEKAPPEKEPPLIWRLLFHNRVARFLYNHSYLIVRLLLLLGIAAVIRFIFIK